MTAPTLPLQNAADVLDILAAGGIPERPALLAAALALNTHCQRNDADRDWLDAAAGRERAAKLAALVRQHAVS